MKKYTIGLINHGCAKNLVDSELMLGILHKKGFLTTLDAESADAVIVNTCSFIHDAEKESVKSIVSLVQAGKKLIITGCLPQKHKMELVKALPEVPAFLGTSDISKIADVIKNILNNPSKIIFEVSENPLYKYPENVERQQITVGSSSYIKIADGCNYKCGYCIIPTLRGKYQSRTIENITTEAKYLGKKGVNEIILVAQDTTSYGKDIYGKPQLAKLLNELNKIDEIEWIRVMYAYPSLLSDEVITAFAKLEKVVKYIDIPLQHSHPEILRMMNRPTFDYSDLIKKLRDNINGVSIRTAFITGYPGETDEHFEHLFKFVEKNRFDKLGVFEYSREKNTDSYSQKPQIAAKIKKQRKKELMLLQQGISRSINRSFLNKKIPVIIESIPQKGAVKGRTYRDAPEIDGLIYISTNKSLIPGNIEIAKITDADEYDMQGSI
jgi:ribosomal protein S12 methylthiotransferase